MTSRTVTIPHLGRVEGHGGIHVTLAGRHVTDVNMDIHEGSRYYEKLLVKACLRATVPRVVRALAAEA